MESKTDPVARDPTRPQQRQLAIKVNAGGTPQRKHQRSGWNRSRNQKRKSKKKSPAQLNDPERGCLRRPALARAREKAPLRSRNALSCRPVEVPRARREAPSAVQLRSGWKSKPTPVARDPTRPQQRQLAIKVNAGGTPQRKHQRSGWNRSRNQKRKSKKKSPAQLQRSRARLSAPPRPRARAREGAIKVNAAAAQIFRPINS